MMGSDPLQGALQECSLHSLLMVTSKALSRAGFGDVEILDRRQTWQRSRFGGHEMSCEAGFGTLRVRAVIKVVRDVVRTRMLDELAGTVLRMGADVGIIVTPHNVSASAAGIQGKYGGTRIEAMDGAELARLMRCSGIGVRPSGEPDWAFFSELETVSARLLEFVGKDRP